MTQATDGPGTCYDLCTPFDSTTPCPSGMECRSATYSQSLGICVNPGVGTVGNPCDPTSSEYGTVSTGCENGAICLVDENGDNPTCYETCDFFGANPQCTQAGESCFLFGYCYENTETIDSTALGDACPASAQLGDPCAPHGDAFDGVCQDVGSGTICYEVCRVDNTYTCAVSGTSCQDVFSDPYAGEVGLCL